MNAARLMPKLEACDAADEQPPPVKSVWAEPRSLFFFKTAALHTADGEEACELIALAESGAMLRSASLHRQGEQVTLELNSIHRFAGIIAWAEDGRLGLEFDDTQLIRDVLACREVRFPYRAPRLGLRCEVRVTLGPRELITHCHDVSEAGVKVELPADDCTGLPAIVVLEGMEPVAGKVEWWREGRAGISFDQPIPMAQFAQWVTERLDRTAR